jgi:hypothetical protein
VQNFPKCKKKSWCSAIMYVPLTETQSADPHLATALEGRFVGYRGKQPQSDVVEGSEVPGVCLLQCLHENSGGHFERFL